MLVLTTHGRSGLTRTLLGSVADEVVRRAAGPVLLLPGAAPTDWLERPPEGRRVLVTLDGSPLAEEVLGPACALAAALDAELLLVRVVLPLMPEYMAAQAVVGRIEPEDSLVEAQGYLEAVAQHLRAYGVRVETHALLGSPIPTVVQLAQTSRADAIAMATHGRGGAARLVFGSVATGVLQRTAVPLLVLRPTTAPIGPSREERAPQAVAPDSDSAGRPTTVASGSRSPGSRGPGDPGYPSDPGDPGDQAIVEGVRGPDDLDPIFVPEHLRDGAT